MKIDSSQFDPKPRPPGDTAILYTVTWFSAYTLTLAAGIGVSRWLAFAGPIVVWRVPSGIFLAALLLAPPRRWLALAAITVSMLWLTELSAVDGKLPVRLAFDLASNLGTILVAAAIRRSAGGQWNLERPGDIGKLAAWTLLLHAPVTAAIAKSCSALFSAEMGWREATIVWGSDALGITVVTPFILLFHDQYSDRRAGPFAPRWWYFEFLVSFGIAATTAWWLYGSQLAEGFPPTILIPFLLHAAFRLGIRSVFVYLFTWITIAIIYTRLGFGPHAAMASPVGRGVESLQLVFLMFAYIGQCVAAAWGERGNAVRQLRDANLDLERTVDSRTAALTRMSNALQWQEQRLQLAFKAAHAFAFEWSVASDVVWASREREQILGLKEGACRSGREYFELVHPDDRDAFISVLTHRSREEPSYCCQYRLIRPDGDVVTLEETGQAIFEEAGQVTKLIGICTNITQRKHIENALRDSEDRFRALAETVPDFVFTCRPDGECDYLSPLFYSLTGLPVGSGLGSGWLDALHPEDRVTSMERWLESVRQAKPYEDKYRLRIHPDIFRWFRAKARPIQDGRGQVTRWCGVSSDINDLIQAEQALRESDRRKDDFLARLGHELRNPLAGIVGGVDVMNLIDMPAEARQMRDIISRQARLMQRLIDDLLDISRIARGKIQLRHEDIDLRELVRVAVEDHRVSIEQQGVQLTLSLPNHPVLSHGDHARLVQVISNLLQNSRKFTETNGSIHVALTVDNRTKQAVIEVADTGVGMTRETLDRLFEPFAQADRTLNRSQGGLGLGLALVKGLVDLHGGEINASSGGLGKGSQLSVRLPLVGPTSHRADFAPIEIPDAKFRVLVVDDQRDAAIPIVTMLERDGHEVELASDGRRAIELAAQIHPDVILCDIGLPLMNGYEVAQCLRARPEFTDVFLAAITGYGRAEDREAALRSGFDMHITKPVSFEELRKVIHETRRRKQSQFAEQS